MQETIKKGVESTAEENGFAKNKSVELVENLCFRPARW